MGLKEYKAKRKFTHTPEPKGSVKKKHEGSLRFYIQKHHASHLHYDFRLEMEGVLKSWAIPKGPSMNPKDKRLAMMVEDHPMEYGTFEGIIPKGNYGAGTVMLWDEGEYFPLDSEGREEAEKKLKAGLKAGNLKFVLNGKKLKGEFALVKIKREKENEWLLIKKKDQYYSEEKIIDRDRSVLSDRNLEEIKEESQEGKAVWYSSKATDVEIIIPSDALKNKMPDLIKPMMATLVEAAFDSEDWIFEVKWDGYRAIAEVNYNEVNLYSRNQLSFSESFPDVVESLLHLGIQAVFDGEICAVDEEGIPRFELIQNYRRSSKGTILYYIFDLLYYKGYDLTTVPLIERKNILSKLIPENHPVLRVSDHIIGEGLRFFEASRKQRLEGIIAKKKMSTYQVGVRGKDWLKVKNLCEQEAVIAGFTEPRGGRKKFGALILGVYENDKLKYIGHTGGGFDQVSLEEIYALMEKLIIKQSPFEILPKTNMPVTWIKPNLVCQVKFQEWTADGIMRQPIFLGLRVDKNPKEVKREFEKSLKSIKENGKTKRSEKAKVKNKIPTGKTKNEKKRGQPGRNRGTGEKISSRPAVSGRTKARALKDAGDLAESKKYKKLSEDILSKSKEIIYQGDIPVRSFFSDSDYLDEERNEAQKKVSGNILKFTNLKKLYWPAERITKEDLLEYYHKISPYILPYLQDRPQSLRRNPNGAHSNSFFQKDMPSSIPDWLETKKIYSESNDKDINYLIAKDKASLLYMVNLGCIELNPWLSKVDQLEYPDYIVIDLDPQDVPFERVIEVAQAVKEVLDIGEIKGYCKTSGSRGLHVYIPLAAKYDYDQAKIFAEIIAQLTHQLVPEITSLERMPNKRRNKIYLDYLQNRKGQTLAAPYCVRPKPGATVSTPLEWEEVKEGLHPSQFDIHTIFHRIKSKGDIFKEVLGKGSEMEKALKNFGYI